MRQSRYLNAILTVNAVLLAGLLWTQVAGTPLLATEAAAQSRTRTEKPKGLPNASEQRSDMVKAMSDVKSSVESLKKLLESGKVRVKVDNLEAGSSH